MKVKLLKHLESFVTENRISLIGKIINDRTRYITVVLEDIFQSHNASAVLRTCDCFGIQDIHIIENANKYQINPDVALGSNKWLSLYKYSGEEDNTFIALKSLKENGYRIVAATPENGSKDLGDIDLSAGKIALIFGTELKGLSKTAIENADEFVKIPMFGFTQSFNISVSAAIILFHLSSELRKSEINWQLSEDEKTDLKLQWIKNSIKMAETIEKEFLNSNNMPDH